MKIQTLATFAAAVTVLALPACASPTEAEAPPPEAVATTQQAIVVTSNCDDHGNYQYDCHARDGSSAGEPGVTYKLLDLLGAWVGDWVVIENTGTSPVTIFVDQGFSSGNYTDLEPGSTIPMKSIDTGYPLYALYMRTADGVDPATVRLRVEKRD